MRWFYNLRTATKLILSFSVVCLILCGVAYLGLDKMSQINTALGTLYNRDLRGLADTKDANINMACIGRAVRQALLDEDKAAMEQQVQRIAKHSAGLRECVDKVAGTLATEEGQARMAKVQTALPGYLEAVHVIGQQTLKGQRKEAQAQVAQAAAVGGQIDAELNWIADAKDGLAKQAYEQSAQDYRTAWYMVLGDRKSVV